jgi:lysophospholipase L1-like esterase
LAIEKLSIGGNNKMKFKRLSVLLTLMLAFSTFFTSFAFAEETIDKPNLVALGDSITFGLNLDDTNGNTQPSLKSFPNLILDGGLNVTNISGSGWTSGHILSQVNNSANEAAIQNADVFTLNIGSNDLMGAVGLSKIIENGTTVDPTTLQPLVLAASQQLGQNLQQIFTKIRSLNNEAPIILYNIYNPFAASQVPFNAFLHTIGEQIVTGVNADVIGKFANAPGTFIANAKVAFDGKQAEYIIPGDIHPTVIGQGVLAGLATEILLSLMPEELVVDLAATSTEETTGPVTIEVQTNAEEVLSMMWLEGDLSADKFYDGVGSELGKKIVDNKFEVTKNRTYTVYVLDAYGQETVQTITIENIKDEPVPTQPVVNPDTTSLTPVTSAPAPATQVKATGYAIPNTASPAYNLMALGSVVLLAGFVTLQVQRRRRQDA